MRPQASRASSPNPTANLVGTGGQAKQTPRIIRGVCHLGFYLLAPFPLSVTLRKTTRGQIVKAEERAISPIGVSWDSIFGMPRTNRLDLWISPGGCEAA